LFSSRIRQARGTEGLIRLGVTGFAACTFLTAISGNVLLTMLAMALGGACWVLLLSSFNVTVQVSSPRWVVGRTLALYQTAAFGGMALGSWTWGLAAEQLGIVQALGISALVHLLALLIGLRLVLPNNEEPNLEPLNRWKKPSLSLDIQHRSGPIVVTTDYRIGEEDVREFLILMAERRRIRRRDGARHWHLLRDLAEPELWTERYDTPTWLDYLRSAQRITHADAKIVDRLRELHRGTDLPQVRRRIIRQPVSAAPDESDPSEADHYPTDHAQASG
jgi:MFS family permease